MLRSGRFAVTAELGPPRSASLAPVRRKAKLLHDWVDAANLTDGQSAVVRLPSGKTQLVLPTELDEMDSPYAPLVEPKDPER